jgi:hypothetical protein
MFQLALRTAMHMREIYTLAVTQVSPTAKTISRDQPRRFGGPNGSSSRSMMIVCDGQYSPRSRTRSRRRRCHSRVFEL